MKQSKTNHHGKFPTALLTLSLFLGLFAFSGCLNIASSQEKEGQKTEQVISIKPYAKRAAPYARAFVKFHQGNRCDLRPTEFHLLECFHNLVFKIRLEQNSTQVSSLQKPTRFFQRKSPPANPDEDLFISMRG